MVERSRCQTYGFFLYKNLGIGGKTSKPVGCCCLIPCSARWQYLDAFIDFQLRLLYLPLRPSASAKDFWIGCVLLCFFFFFFCFHINSAEGELRAFVHLFKSALLEWQLTQQFAFPSREHQMMPYPVEENGLHSSTTVPDGRTMNARLCCRFLAVMKAHSLISTLFIPLALCPFDGYLLVFRQIWQRDGSSCSSRVQRCIIIA